MLLPQLSFSRRRLWEDFFYYSSLSVWCAITQMWKMSNGVFSLKILHLFNCDGLLGHFNWELNICHMAIVTVIHCIHICWTNTFMAYALACGFRLWLELDALLGYDYRFHQDTSTFNLLSRPYLLQLHAKQRLPWTLTPNVRIALTVSLTYILMYNYLACRSVTVGTHSNPAPKCDESWITRMFSSSGKAVERLSSVASGWVSSDGRIGRKATMSSCSQIWLSKRLSRAVSKTMTVNNE